MFYLVDKGNYDIRIYYVHNNRKRETLFPLVKKKIYTYYNSLLNNNNENENFLAIRISSDFFLSYQENDFNNSEYILYRFNYSIWFAQGFFHTNNIEGVWSQIRRWTNDFAGLNGNVIHILEAKGINIEEYFNQ